MFPKENFIIPFLQLIKAFEVVRKDRPRMTGTSALGLATKLYFQNNKYTENMNSPILIKISLTTPLGALVERLTNWRIVLVDFNSPNPSFSCIEYGSKLTLAFKSNNALWMVQCPISIDMVGQPGSFMRSWDMM